MIVWACSGGGELIALAELHGLLLAVGSALAVTLTVLARWALGSGLRTLGNGLGGLMVVVHPWGWLAARSGDCGMALELASIAWSALIGVWMVLAILAAAVHRSLRRRRLSASEGSSPGGGTSSSGGGPRGRRPPPRSPP